MKYLIKNSVLFFSIVFLCSSQVFPDYMLAPPCFRDVEYEIEDNIDLIEFVPPPTYFEVKVEKIVYYINRGDTAKALKFIEEIGYVDLSKPIPLSEGLHVIAKGTTATESYNKTLTFKIVNYFISIMLRAGDPKLCKWAIRCLSTVRQKNLQNINMVQYAILCASNRFDGDVLGVSLQSLAKLYIINHIEYTTSIVNIFANFENSQDEKIRKIASFCLKKIEEEKAEREFSSETGGEFSADVQANIGSAAVTIKYTSTSP